MKALTSVLQFICILLVLSSSSTILAQNPEGDEEGLAISTIGTEWVLLQDIQGIQIYGKRTECNDIMNGMYKEFVLLRIVNTMEVNFRIEWDMQLWYDEKCRTCGLANNAEYHYMIEVAGGEAREGNCSLNSPRELTLFLRFLNYEHIAKLTKFNFANLKVNPK